MYPGMATARATDVASCQCSAGTTGTAASDSSGSSVCGDSDRASAHTDASQLQWKHRLRRHAAAVARAPMSLRETGVRINRCAALAAPLGVTE